MRNKITDIESKSALLNKYKSLHSNSSKRTKSNLFSYSSALEEMELKKKSRQNVFFPERIKVRELIPHIGLIDR